MSAESIKRRGAIQQKSVCLHASAVSVSGKALLFLGHSTAGKSTICRLLSERYPEIADDKVWVYQIKNGCWMVRDGSNNGNIENNCGNPNGRGQYPLLAILRIFKSNTAQIDPISQKETCKYLMDAVFEIDFQRKIIDLKIRKRWFRLVAEISRKIEGRRLTFNKDTSIIRKIHDNFEEMFLDGMDKVERSKEFTRGKNEKNEI